MLPFPEISDSNHQLVHLLADLNLDLSRFRSNIGMYHRVRTSLTNGEDQSVLLVLAESPIALPFSNGSPDMAEFARPGRKPTGKSWPNRSKVSKAHDDRVVLVSSLQPQFGRQDSRQILDKIIAVEFDGLFEAGQTEAQRLPASLDQPIGVEDQQRSRGESG